MEDWLRLLGLGTVTAILALSVRKQSPELALLISLAGCVLAAVGLLGWLAPILDLLRRLGDKAGLEDALLAPLWKVPAIGLLTQIAAAVCQDAGQSALAKLLELGGGLLCLVSALPLLEAVLSLMEELL